MSTTMPEFEMPEVPPPAGPPADASPAPAVASIGPASTAADVSAVLGATELTVESAPVASAPAPRPRVVWRHVLAAGLVGALVGAGVPATVQALDRAAAAAEVDGLRSLAEDYLTAIAERRADDATSLVPLVRQADRAVAAPAALLASARPIERQEVRMVHIDGDVGSVEVRYRVAGQDVERSLEAERVDGRWQLLTSLAERASVQPYDEVSASIGGIDLDGRDLRLYPGTYALDRVEGPVLATGGERFVVDGDPQSPTEIWVQHELVPDLAALASDYAIAAAAACQLDRSCAIPEGALLGAQDGVHVQWRMASGPIVLGVPLMATTGATSEWLEMQVQLTVDAEGTPVLWECGRPGTFDAALVPCPALG
ncbi:hypothetical protein [Agrococcus sp. TF02-05]|uniref:hypothetical protein n=1 Tax=Agrococcus sp. TF02-05 TaxID=2815211 RepID=UPI001AA0E2AC|nr:hypothetical protein [Agrococcus sp. TF02-05]MBO1770397.1 hypothetical protein [Agrococcus sp. TF02-05]